MEDVGWRQTSTTVKSHEAGRAVILSKPNFGSREPGCVDVISFHQQEVLLFRDEPNRGWRNSHRSNWYSFTLRLSFPTFCPFGTIRLGCTGNNGSTSKTNTWERTKCSFPEDAESSFRRILLDHEYYRIMMPAANHSAVFKEQPISLLQWSSLLGFLKSCPQALELPAKVVFPLTCKELFVQPGLWSWSWISVKGDFFLSFCL